VQVYQGFTRILGLTQRARVCVCVCVWRHRHIADVCRLCGSLLSPTLLPAPLGVGTATAADKRVVCRTCDTAKGVEKVALPYVFKYLAAELAAMNIRVMLTLSE
jgi:DNA-directed RNA polymerase I subunit RPA2